MKRIIQQCLMSAVILVGSGLLAFGVFKLLLFLTMEWILAVGMIVIAGMFLWVIWGRPAEL